MAILYWISEHSVEIKDNEELSQFALSHSGRYIIKLKTRLTTCVDNHFYDEKDYTGFKVYAAWKVK